TLGKPKLKPVESIFTSFTGHYLQINGETLVKVDYNSQHIQLRLLVGHNHRNILGRDWIKALNLNKLTLDDILFNDNKILNVNPDELGCCKIKAHLHIKNDIKPKFFKARSLPFAYRQAVELDLNRLVSANVLEPINTANWAAPILVVPKPGGKVRLCADFSTGVNQALDIDRYPLPKPNDLFVALNGGIKFSKIDFSEAYLQVELDDDSKELLVINTHKGLFRFNRLPFGIASAPSIFQQIMDQMLAGLEGTVCYLDDIIVTENPRLWISC
ncbi:unnamed protein product, partial [Rotaria magnacalcarata]